MSASRSLLALVAATALALPPAHSAEGRPEVTRHALAAPAAAERSVASLAAYLAANAPAAEDRAWAIFVWISDRIAYDIDAYLSGRFRDETATAEGVLQRRSSVCDGFSALFSALAQAAGLDVVTVQGYAKAYGVPEQTRFASANHAWNLVGLDGRWQVVDPTWGAGYVFDDRYKKQLDTVYFLAQAEELKFTHWPIDDGWRQAMGLGLAKEQFEALARVDPGLFRAGVTGRAISETLAEPGHRGLVTVFEQNHRDLRVRRIPLSQHLRAGRAYRFELSAPAFAELVVMNGGAVSALASAEGLFAGEFRPAPGPLLIGGRPKEGGRLSGLFQYTVE